MYPTTRTPGALLGAIAAACIAAPVARSADITLAPTGSDDTTRINNAILAARPGDNIVLLPGAFRITGSIVGRSGIDLLGSGRDTTRIDYVGSTSKPMLSLSNTSDVQVSGFTLNGNNNQAAVQGINAANASRLTIDGLRVQNLVAGTAHGPHGVYFSSAVTDSVIRNSDFSNIGTNSLWGAGVRLSWGSSRNQVLNNTIRNTGRGGILANDNSTSLLIRGNVVTGSGLAPNSPGLGIELFNLCDRSIVEDNRIDHWLSLDNTSLTAVRRNTITSSTGPVKFAGLEFARAGSDTVFTGNTVSGGQHIGISVSGPGTKERVYWAHNTVRDMQTWGAQIQGETGGARKMYFFGNTIQDTVTAPGNLYPNQGHGFRFNGNSQHMVLDSNQIVNNGQIGVQLGGSGVDQLEFRNNRITTNDGPAVTNSFGTVGPYQGEDLRWSGNSVSQNGNNYQLTSTGDFDGNQAPIASIVVSGSGLIGEPVQFGFLYGDDGNLGNVLWDFDAGIPSTTIAPSYTYSEPGVYRVGLVVWDAGGRAAHDEIFLSISAPVPEPGLVAIFPLAALMLRRRR